MLPKKEQFEKRREVLQDQEKSLSKKMEEEKESLLSLQESHNRKMNKGKDTLRSMELVLTNVRGSLRQLDWALKAYAVKPHFDDGHGSKKKEDENKK